MANRGNIVVRQYSDGETSDGNVFIYVHDLGEHLPKILQAALIRGRSRWHDESYLTRIIVSEVASEAGIDEETGMGISTYSISTHRPWLVVDARHSVVFVCDDEFANPRRRGSFIDFIALEDPDIRK